MQNIKTFIIYLLSSLGLSSAQARNQKDVFKTELFLNKNDLNSGLYEGEVKGRRRFGGTQVPHGFGSIFYFSNDKFNRVNYTGEWVNGDREGNGTTHFRDGAVYQGEYKSGLEHGQGYIIYPNGNSLDAEFVGGKIMGHGVFRYATGDQREGFFVDNILDGQVIFTRRDGTTAIEKWVKGEKVSSDDNDIDGATVDDDTRVSSNSIVNISAKENNKIDKQRGRNTEELPYIANLVARGGQTKTNLWSKKAKTPTELEKTGELDNLTKITRSKARSFLFEIYSNVN